MGSVPITVVKMAICDIAGVGLGVSVCVCDDLILRCHTFANWFDCCVHNESDFV